MDGQERTDVAPLRRAATSIDRVGNPARTARAFAADALRTWGWHDLEVLELLVSELASNAVQHTTSTTIGVVVQELADRRARVEITNEGLGTPTPQPPDPRRVGGHGLAVVAGLSTGWGVRHADGATTVWFDLEAASADVR